MDSNTVQQSRNQTLPRITRITRIGLAIFIELISLLMMRGLKSDDAFAYDPESQGGLIELAGNVEKGTAKSFFRGLTAVYAVIVTLGCFFVTLSHWRSYNWSNKGGAIC